MMYILVPKDNLTEGRWKETVELLRQIPHSKVPDYEFSDPDAPIFSEIVGDYDIFVHGLEFNFRARYVTESSYPNEAFPIPESMGLVSGYIWDKNGPHMDNYQDRTLAVMRAVFCGMGGVFANFESEVSYWDAHHFKQFMWCHYGYLMLSWELVAILGRDFFERTAEVIEYKGGVEVQPRTRWSVLQNDIFNELLRDDGMFNPELLQTPPLDFEDDEIGLVMEPRFSRREKALKDLMEPLSESANLSMDDELQNWWATREAGETIEAWATRIADRAISGSDYTYKDNLYRLLNELDWINDLEGQRDVLRQILRVDLNFHPQIGFENIEDCGMLAQVLSELGEYEEADSLYRSILGVEEGLKQGVSYHTISSHARLMHKMGRLDDAEVAFRRAIELSDPASNPRDFTSGLKLTELATICLEKGEVDKASEAMAHAKPLAAFWMDRHPENMSKYLGVRAQISMAEGNLERAVDLARRGVNFSWSNERARAEEVIYNLEVLAEVLVAMGNNDGAEEARREVEDLFEAGSKEVFLERKKGIPEQVDN
jgi:tetratricopeptide (TPR) repeat protein